MLKKVREQRAKLAQRLAMEKKKLREEKAKFRKQKAGLIKKAVDMRTRRLESQIKALRRKEEQIEKRARDKIRRATALAHSRAKKLEAARFNSLKKKLRASVRNQLRRERERGALRERRRYGRLERTFRSTLRQMRAKDTQLQEQARQIKELQRQLERQTTPQIEGLLYEGNLVRELRKRFPKDKFQHIGKGGDVIQNVMRNGQQVGVIVYECKRVKHYSTKHVKQASEAKKQRNADFAILVTNAMKKGTHGFFIEKEKGVIVVHATGVLSIAVILRGQIIQIAGMKLGQFQRDKAIEQTLEYLEGPEFANSMDAIIQESIAVVNELKDEMKKHWAAWKKRYLSYKKIYEEASTVKSTSKTLLSGETKHKLIQKDTLPVLEELPEAEKPIEVTVPARKKKHRSGSPLLQLETTT